MTDRKVIITLLMEIGDHFDRCRRNAAVGGKAEKYFEGLQSVARDAAELLKAQDPVAPKTHNGGGESATWWCVCGACEHAVSLGDHYCGNCGRAVKWDED